MNFASPKKIRPAFGANKLKFFGAIDSMERAGIIGDLGLAPLCLSSFPDHLLQRILEAWQIRCTAAGHSSDVAFPISISVSLHGRMKRLRRRR
jgi:hypothetical protein